MLTIVMFKVGAYRLSILPKDPAPTVLMNVSAPSYLAIFVNAIAVIGLTRAIDALS